MEKWKSSILAKVTAWILMSVSVLCFLTSAFGAMLMADNDVYRLTRSEMRQESFEKVCYEYGLAALEDFRRNQNKETQNTDISRLYADNPNFKYGIILAESLDGIDLNKEKSYAVRNFTEKVSLDDVYVHPFNLSAEDEIIYDTKYGLSFFVPDDIQLTYNRWDDWEKFYADGIYYDTATGIISYRSMDEYFPANSVEVTLKGQNEEENGSIYVTYDAQKRKYQIQDTDGEQVRVQQMLKESDSEMTKTEEAQTYTEEEMVEYDSFAGAYFTFDMLSGTALDTENWGDILLDGVRLVAMEDVKQMNSKEDSEITYTSRTDYYLDENYTLVVQMSEQASEEITYQMVFLLPESVETGDFHSSDMFVQANTFVNFIYHIRYAVFFVMIFSFAVGVGAFVFLMSAAGHRKYTNEIVPTFMDKVPLEILIGLTGAVEIFLASIGYLTAASLTVSDFVPMLAVAIVIMLGMGWLFLFFLLSVSVRIKCGKWWRNSICYHLFRKIWRFVRMILENIGFLWSVILVMLILAFFEAIGVLLFLNTSLAFLLWLLEKLVLYPLILWYCVQINQLKAGIEKIAGGEVGYQISTKYMTGIFRKQAEQMNHISDGMTYALEERMKSERFKTELITNVSHDIKTPLTSIINYVDLLEKEELHNETAKEYLEVLERQSGRLKKLIEDLIEASKASTGNLSVHLECLEAGIFMIQTVGEFEEKTQAAGLELVIEKPDEAVYIMADSRHFWRVIDNLMNNICKYAQSGTRVYINLQANPSEVSVTFRNTSKYPLNISSDELMERFVRGDSSRSTEGSGLGLSIASSLMELMGGTFQLYVDGDLFKVSLGFARAEEKEGIE